jgi:hypothetical protein
MSLVEFRQQLPYRGFASRIFLPSDAELEAIGDKMPYAFVLFDPSMIAGLSTGTIAAQQTARGYTSQPDGCYITHLVGSSSQAAGFVLQIYDTERQQLWTPQPIRFNNVLGTAQQPFWLKKIYKLPANAQLQCRVTNLATAANFIQVVGWGLRD